MRSKRESGMTLIEVMITMSILAVGILSIIHMQVGSLRANGRTHTLSEASRILSSCAEEVGMTSFTYLQNIDSTQTCTEEQVALLQAATLTSPAKTPRVQMNEGGVTIWRLVGVNSDSTLTVYFRAIWAEADGEYSLSRSVVKAPDMES